MFHCKAVKRPLFIFWLCIWSAGPLFAASPAAKFGFLAEVASNALTSTSFTGNYADSAHAFYQGTDVLRVFSPFALKGEASFNTKHVGGRLQLRVDNIADGINSWYFGEWSAYLKFNLGPCGTRLYIANSAREDVLPNEPHYGRVETYSALFDGASLRGLYFNSPSPSLGKNLWSIRNIGYGVLKGAVVNNGKTEGTGSPFTGEHPFTRDLRLDFIDVSNIGEKADGTDSEMVMVADFGFLPLGSGNAQDNPHILVFSLAAPAWLVSEDYNTSSKYKTTNINFNFRAEASFENACTVAALYKVAHTERKYDNALTYTKGAEERTAHAFGINASINALPNWGFGLGFSGLINSYTPKEYDKKTYHYPFYGGFDLRIMYGGEGRFHFALNGNVSFSTMKGDDDPNTFIYGVFNSDSDMSPTGTRTREESYTGLSLAFVAAYKPLNNLELKGQFAAQSASGKTINIESEENSYKGNSFSVFAGVEWQAKKWFCLRMGFEVRAIQFQYDRKVTGSAGNADYGAVQYIVPFSVKFSY